MGADPRPPAVSLQALSTPCLLRQGGSSCASEGSSSTSTPTRFSLARGEVDLKWALLHGSALSGDCHDARSDHSSGSGGGIHVVAVSSQEIIQTRVCSDDTCSDLVEVESEHFIADGSAAREAITGSGGTPLERAEVESKAPVAHGAANLEATIASSGAGTVLQPLRAEVESRPFAVGGTAILEAEQTHEESSHMISSSADPLSKRPEIDGKHTILSESSAKKAFLFSVNLLDGIAGPDAMRAMYESTRVTRIHQVAGSRASSVSKPLLLAQNMCKEMVLAGLGQGLAHDRSDSTSSFETSQTVSGRWASLARKLLSLAQKMCKDAVLVGLSTGLAYILHKTISRYMIGQVVSMVFNSSLLALILCVLFNLVDLAAAMRWLSASALGGTFAKSAVELQGLQEGVEDVTAAAEGIVDEAAGEEGRVVVEASGEQWHAQEGAFADQPVEGVGAVVAAAQGMIEGGRVVAEAPGEQGHAEEKAPADQEENEDGEEKEVVVEEHIPARRISCCFASEPASL